MRQRSARGPRAEVRFTEDLDASGVEIRARPAGQAPQRNHVNPHEDWACAHPHGFVSVQFSRNRCRPAADSQSLAGPLGSQGLFSGPPGGGLLSESALGFSRVLLAGKIGPGHRRGRGRYGSRPGMSSVKLLRREKRRAGKRSAPPPAGKTPGEGYPASGTRDPPRREERAHLRAEPRT